MNSSLERRLSIWVCIVITVAGLLATLYSFVLSRHEANELQDAELIQIAALANASPLATQLERFVPRDEEDAETRLIIKRLGSDRPVDDPTLDVTLPTQLPLGLQTINDRGVQWRVLVGEHASEGTFAIAQKMKVRDEVARDSALRALLPLMILIPVLLLLVRLIIHRAFKPLAILSRQVELVDDSSTTELATDHIPSETLPLVRAMNRTLQRISHVLETQRHLVADAAHELRSPVAALMVQATNLSNTEMSAETRTRLATLQGGLQRMATLLEQVLSLARIQGTNSEPRGPINLADVVTDVFEAALDQAQAKRIDLGCLRLEAAVVRGSPTLLHVLLRNAVDNAVRYTPLDGSVDVSVYSEAGEAHFIVEDTGPGLSDADRARAFEPFFRVLGTPEPGSGLGLAIVMSAATALGGTVRLTQRPDGKVGLRFHYRQATA